MGGYWLAGAGQFRFLFELLNRVRPKDHLDVLRRGLPSRYSPLQDSGNGIQTLYLTEVPQPLAEVLIGWIGREAAQMNERAP